MLIERFLKMKAWLLFLLSFGSFFVVYLLFFTTIPVVAIRGEVSNLFIIPFVILGSIFLFTVLLWFWSVGVGLQKRVNKEIRSETKFFKIIFFITLFCFIFLFMFSLSLFYIPAITEILIKSRMLFYFFKILFYPSILYLIYFVAKTFKTVELNRRVSFSDFAGDFFLVLFFPVGVWIIQPKINKMAQ